MVQDRRSKKSRDDDDRLQSLGISSGDVFQRNAQVSGVLNRTRPNLIPALLSYTQIIILTRIHKDPSRIIRIGRPQD